MSKVGPNRPACRSSFAALPLAPRKGRPALAFTRPGGPHRGADLTDLQRHGFVFSRPVSMADLGEISPSRLDSYDQANYHREGAYWVSNRNTRFVLADLGKIDAATVIAMLALDKCLVIRVPAGLGKTTSIYLTGFHTWALWGWWEAAERGDIAKQGNTLVHIDDHPDISSNMHVSPSQQLLGSALKALSIERIMEEEVKGGKVDPEGISTFIAPAGSLGLVGDVYWEYGTTMTQEARRAKGERILEQQGIIRERDRFLREGDPAGVWTDSRTIREWFDPLIKGCRTTMHSEQTSYRDPTFVIASGEFVGYRSDHFPFSTVYRRPGGQIILDVDIDVADGVKGVVEIVRPHLKATRQANCITIAVSPQFGARENHVKKVMAILSLLKLKGPSVL